MNQKLDVKLSAGSWIYIAGLIGLCGGIVLGVLSALWSAMQGEWVAAFVAVIAGPICGLLSFALYAVLGYLIYNWVASHYPNSRVVSGVFKQCEQNQV